MYDIIIIGGGPAGMTAGLYAKRMGKTVLVLESEVFGGQITKSPKVENYPGIKTISGNEFAESLLDQIIGIDVQIELENVESLIKKGNAFEVITNYNKYECISLIAATGCNHRHLDIKSSLCDNISYCAVCDGIFYKDKTVAVVGGGNSALQEALYLCSICKKVYLIHRRCAFRGDEKLVCQLKSRVNAEFVLESVVTKLCGQDKLESIEVKNVISSTTKNLELSGLFVAIGQIPNTKLFKDILNLNAEGFIIADENCKTSAEGIFAAGDCRTKEVNQLATAIADGAVSAINACKYIDSL